MGMGTGQMLTASTTPYSFTKKAVMSTGSNVQVDIMFNMMDEYVESVSYQISIGSEGYQQSFQSAFQPPLHPASALKDIGAEIAMNAEMAVHTIIKRHKDVNKAVSIIMAN
jgi:hypothetical protein